MGKRGKNGENLDFRRGWRVYRGRRKNLGLSSGFVWDYYLAPCLTKFLFGTVSPRARLYGARLSTVSAAASDSFLKETFANGADVICFEKDIICS